MRKLPTRPVDPTICASDMEMPVGVWPEKLTYRGEEYKRGAKLLFGQEFAGYMYYVYGTFLKTLTVLND
jgi:hypothetical protein